MKRAQRHYNWAISYMVIGLITIIIGCLVAINDSATGWGFIGFTFVMNASSLIHMFIAKKHERENK